MMKDKWKVIWKSKHAQERSTMTFDDHTEAYRFFMVQKQMKYTIEELYLYKNSKLIAKHGEKTKDK